MNVETMRSLDHYVGVPLCLVGTIARKFLSLFSDRRQNMRPRNVLFIELSEMGSAVLAEPAMLKLKEALNVNLFFAIFEKNSPSLDLTKTIPRENIFNMRDSGLAAIALDSIRFAFWTRKRNIDTVIDLELFSRFTALLTGLSGAAYTVGFHAFYNEGLYRGDFFSHKVSYNPHQHIAKNFISLVNALLSDKAEVPYSKTVIPDEEISLRKTEVSGEAKEAMKQKIREAFPAFDPEHHAVVIFNTNASDLLPLRRWPQDYFVKLAKRVLDHSPRVLLLLTGDTPERQAKEAIIEAVGSGRCVNFAGGTTLAELPALYSVSAFMLTNDSGPAHFASVTDMRVFVLYGPETPKLYGSLGSMTPIYSGLACSPCVSAANHRKTACTDNVCLQIISPEQVFEVIRPYLDVLQ